MSVVCAFTGSLHMLFLMRFLQGIGVGGEVPVAATYINELSQAHGRGRFFILYELIFPLGQLAAAQLGAFIVPRFGWEYVPYRGCPRHRRNDPDRAPSRIAALAHFTWAFR